MWLNCTFTAITILSTWWFAYLWEVLYCLFWNIRSLQISASHGTLVRQLWGFDWQCWVWSDVEQALLLWSEIIKIYFHLRQTLKTFDVVAAMHFDLFFTYSLWLSHPLTWQWNIFSLPFFAWPNWLHVRSNLFPGLTYERLIEEILFADFIKSTIWKGILLTKP